MAMDLHLGETQERAQRIAVLGSLACGVGHDLRNIVMPALLRLDVLAASTELAARTRADLSSIRNSLMQLQHLADGLSLLSADVWTHSDSAGFTRLDEWWAGLRVLLAEALPSATELVTSIPDDLPAASITPAALAQVVASVLLISGQTLTDVPRSRVSITATVDDTGCLQLAIRHNGGAPARPHARHDDKTDRFGLETCRALMQRFGGDLHVEMPATGGTVFHLQLRPASPDRRRALRVRVLVSDPRVLAIVRMVLTQRRVSPVPFAYSGAVDTIITDAASLPIALRTRDQAPEDVTQPTAIIALGASMESVEGVRWIEAFDSDALEKALA